MENNTGRIEGRQSGLVCTYFLPNCPIFYQEGKDTGSKSEIGRCDNSIFRLKQRISGEKL